MSKFAERLKELRKNIHKTQKQVAELTGLPVTSIEAYENDKHQPSIFAAIVLADFYKVSLDYLTGRTDNK